MIDSPLRGASMGSQVSGADSSGGIRTPKPCISCRRQVVAWTRPRVDFCYTCLPGGPFTPPPCRRCGSLDYYSQGLCIRCHLAAPQSVTSCRDCLAWGVIRKHKWLCWRCRSWRARRPHGTCRICHRADLPLDAAGQCQLCDRQTVVHLGTTLEQANRHGQQLYLANLPWPATRSRPTANGPVRRPDTPNPWATGSAPATAGGSAARVKRPQAVTFYPVGFAQLTLFDMRHDLRALIERGAIAEPRDEQMATFLDAAAADHGRRHGWSTDLITETRTGLRVLQVVQDTAGAVLLASDATQLKEIGLPVNAVITVAAAAGLMLDDRQPAIHTWFDTTTAALPGPMRAELTEWFDVMLNGSRTPPRRQPRDQQTIRLALRWAMPALTVWAEQGHQSLREITPDDVRAILPPAGNPRSTMGAGLRSICTVLKARKTLFVNPIARIRTGGHERRQPLPADADRIRHALTSANPAGAALTALTAFHGLRAGQLRNLYLTDLVDGRLHVGNRSIPLAEPVRVRLNAWLDQRNRQWPRTANPHIFINHRNAGSIDRVGGRWLTLMTGIPIHVLREDRIVHEAQATGGDIRRMCDLFGLTVEGALRYLPTFEPGHLEEATTTGQPDESDRTTADGHR